MKNDDRLGLLITIPAKPENVAVIRHAVAGLAEQLGMREPSVGDLKTVVTEACMNVVVHAYEGEPGPLQVEARVEEEGLTVSVRDFGRGIRPTAGDERQSLRIGLTLIAALSSSFAISGGLNKGTEVRMHLFLDPTSGDGLVGDAGARASAPEQAELRIDGQKVVAPVLERVIGALAARHPIGIDRLNDALLLADAVSAEAPRAFAEEPYRFAVGDGDGGIDLRVGPLPEGASKRLRDGLSLPGVGGSLETLADDITVEEGEAGEYLIVRFDPATAQGSTTA
ncbi:MAG: ATP-binding protein [Solirubrobacterales bacterium]